MKNNNLLKAPLTIAIALVWFCSGLFAKLLNLVPRHQQIVGRILGEEYAYTLTKTIGVLELLMVVWIISGIQPKLCAWTQIGVVAIMVTMECILTPDLLLFGRANMIPAGIFMGMVYVHAFVVNKTDFKKISLEREMARISKR